MNNQEREFKLAGRRYVKNILCFKCNGTGVVHPLKFVGHSRGFESEPETCPACKGEKVIERVTTVSYR